MSRMDDVYRPALTGKQIPVLTLDNKWHKLFTQVERTPRINRLEKQLNDLLRRQGKLNTEGRDIRKLKKKLMNEVIQLADSLEQQPSARTEKELDEHERLILECGEKLEDYKEELKELPGEIERINYELMLATMDVCYEMIQQNTREIEYLNEWIENTRIELKKNIIRKEEKEGGNQKMYSYMHDIFGPRVIEIFDMKFNPEKKKQPADRGRPRRLRNSAEGGSETGEEQE